MGGGLVDTLSQIAFPECVTSTSVAAKARRTFGGHAEAWIAIRISTEPMDTGAVYLAMAEA